MNRRSNTSFFIVGVLLLIFLASCASAPSSPEIPPAPTFTQDATLQPVVPEIDGIDGGAPRPVTRITDEKGNAADFVANELIIMTADATALQEFVDRWNGAVLRTIDFAAIDPSLTPAHLVRIDPASADPVQLGEDLRTLDPHSRGMHRISSKAGLDTLAVAANEAATGTTVTANWLLQNEDIISGDTAEDPNINDNSLSDPSNAFTWPYMNRGSAQNIGVAAAWQALKAAGVLDDGPRIRIAILDGGFASSSMDDLPANREIVGNYDAQNPMNCSSGNACPWHGTLVAKAAMAIPDDGSGVAGPAGPVADALFLQTPNLDAFEIIEYLISTALQAAGNTPHIVNISAGGRLPASVAALANPFLDGTGKALRFAGILPFTSAGNSADHVDGEDCFWICWEEATYIPCENDGFVCVGGMDWDSNTIARNSNSSGSNWGSENADRHSTVNIFGPYVMLLGPVPAPDSSAGQIVRRSGTSYASPFVAGVAALVWAADPTLSSKQVEDILYRTANTGSGSSEVPRWVNAYDAVVAALNAVPEPYVELLSPDDGATFEEATVVSFEARAISLEGSARYLWELDGQLLSSLGSSFTRRDLCPGDHTVRLVVSNDTQSSPPVQRTITVSNRTPRVEITSIPDKIGEDSDFILKGTVEDPNCTDLAGLSVNPDDLNWYIDGSPIGSGAAVIAQVPSQGKITIEARYTDINDDTGTDTVKVDVGPASSASPQIAISRPMGINGAFVTLSCELGGTTCTQNAYEISFQAIASSSVTASGLDWEYRLDGGTWTSFDSGTEALLRIPYTVENLNVNVRVSHDTGSETITDEVSFSLMGVQL